MQAWNTNTEKVPYVVLKTWWGLDLYSVCLVQSIVW
jgi:hypothetical protein